MRSTFAESWAAWVAVLALGGCVTVYQPLTTFHRPVVIDTQVANFEGLRLTVQCVPEGLLDRTAATQLCNKVSTLFSNQGATVHTITAVGTEDVDDERPPPADMTVELRARSIHLERNAILWVVSFATLTILPAINEYTFAQDVTVRDASGFLLYQDTMQARFVRYFGAGAWLGNWLLDVAVREESEKLSGDAAKRDFSHDFYGQLSQMVFNARMRWLVLREADAAGAAEVN